MLPVNALWPSGCGQADLVRYIYTTYMEYVRANQTWRLLIHLSTYYTYRLQWRSIVGHHAHFRMPGTVQQKCNICALQCSNIQNTNLSSA